MITWMQRHKKWLIVTIWISTIAFVGAGFVGWGSYNYGKSDSAIATVNGNEVPQRDLQNEYSALYSQYAQMFGSSFNQEMAQQFRLEEAALQKTLQKHLLLNYARELGLSVTDKELASKIATMNSFYKDGKFDKDTYLSILKQNNRSVNEFESLLKQDILIEKIQKLYNVNLDNNELNNIASLLFSEDKLSVKVIDVKSLNINLSADEIKKHWDKTKDNYKTPNGFEISYTKVENIADKTKKQMKKIALKEYLDLKKEEKNFSVKTVVYNNDEFLPQSEFEKISNAKNNEVLKPIYKDENYYVIKVQKKIKPKTKPFKEVQALVKDDLKAVKTNKLLEQKAQELLKNFKGKDIGYISRATQEPILDLTLEETNQFIKELFASSKNLNYITLGTKAVVYKITDSKLKNELSDEEKEIVVANVENIKSGAVLNNLIAALEKRYEIKSFMENK